jgi:hypothetical protein
VEVDPLAGAKAELAEFIGREVEERTRELEQTLALARADSISQLAAEERRIAEDRRALVAEREEKASIELAMNLQAVQKSVEGKLAAWAADLERAQANLAVQLASVEQRQKQLMADAETRIAANAERLHGVSDEHTAALARLKADLERAAQESVEAASGELETHAAERRKALHEVGERLRRRERELKEQIEREEAEALRRIQATLADIERRQVEQLKRAVGNEAQRFAEAAALQFDSAVKVAREEAAKRLARELDRAVAVFSREADVVLAEQLAHIGDAGSQQLEKRLRQITAALERQRDEFVEVLERRLVEAESMLRDRVREAAKEGEVERAVLEQRLRELSLRIDEAAERARNRLPSY